MGYRFVIKEVEYPESIKVGERAGITLKIENKGVAPIYNKLPLKLRLKGEKTQEYITDIDITKWLPGQYEENILLEIPSDFATGEYELQIAIEGDDKPSVAFANELETDGNYLLLGKELIER